MPAAAQLRASSSAVSSAERVQPSTVTDAVPRIDRHRHPVAERSRSGGQELFVERGRADEHARGARVEGVLDRVEAAVAAADLHRRAHRGDARDEAEVGIPRERAVEIDEVEPGGALRSEPLGRGDRIASLDGDRFSAALREADDAAIENVYRRIDREALCELAR